MLVSFPQEWGRKGCSKAPQRIKTTQKVKSPHHGRPKEKYQVPKLEGKMVKCHCGSLFETTQTLPAKTDYTYFRRSHSAAGTLFPSFPGSLMWTCDQVLLAEMWACWLELQQPFCTRRWKLSWKWQELGSPMIMQPPNNLWTTHPWTVCVRGEIMSYPIEVPVIWGFAVNSVKHDHNKMQVAFLVSSKFLTSPGHQILY